MTKKGDFLKSLALLTMLVDHIGYSLFPQFLFLRIIGRLAFPIFCFLLARGFRRTCNRKKYAFRLGITAFISQIPYSFFATNGLNILFTLLIGFIILSIFSSKYWWSALLLPLSGHFLPLSYGAYGLYMILLFYWAEENPKRFIPGYFLLTAVYFCINQNHIQVFSFLALLPIVFEKELPWRIPKWFGYAFYPAHITALLLIKNVFF